MTGRELHEVFLEEIEKIGTQRCIPYEDVSFDDRILYNNVAIRLKKIEDDEQKKDNPTYRQLLERVIDLLDKYPAHK